MNFHVSETKSGATVLQLLALSSTAFLMILTETLPAGVLLAMARDLNVSEASVGFLVSAYALASAAAAIPIVALTRLLPRRTLLIVLLACFAIANGVTALSGFYSLTIGSRVVAGLAAGVTWPVVVGYAIRLGRGGDVGRTVAITLAGSTVAMVAGLPIASFIGSQLGWRLSYALLSLIALLLIVWVLCLLPPAQGAKSDKAQHLGKVFAMPGLRLVLLATALGILAHYTLYTYIDPLAHTLALPGGATLALLLFGCGALAGIFVVGRFVDRYSVSVALASPILTVSSLPLLSVIDSTVVQGCILFLWGLSFGGLPTIFQSAMARVAGKENVEVATAMLTTIYNLGIFGGGVVGGFLLPDFGSNGLVWFSIITALLLTIVITKGRHNAFG